jgi:hypothetical protein
MNNPIIIPMFMHIALTGFLYVLLTITRMPSVWGIGLTKDGINPLLAMEKRVSANLSNQFEWPLFFYIACVLLITAEYPQSHVYLWLAWIFVLGRLVHSAIQICTTSIRLRGMAFAINFLAVFGMWCHLLVDYIYP